MISMKEYLEIKEFLRQRVHEINSCDNHDRERQRKKQSKYSLPNSDSYGWMPSIYNCYAFERDHQKQLYIIPYYPFYNFLIELLPHAIFKFHDMFGTGNAMNVITAIYNVSGYEHIGSVNDYQQYLIDHAYCYFLLRDENGSLSDRIFRLDLFRHILPNEKNENVFDFDGGLMHAFRHCSWNGRKLSSGKGEIYLKSIWDLPLLLGEAILNSEDKSSTTFNDGERIWQIHYHINQDTNVYYLKTAFVNSSTNKEALY